MRKNMHWNLLKGDLIKGIGVGSLATAAVIGVSGVDISWPVKSHAVEASRLAGALPSQEASPLSPQTPDDTLVRLNGAFTSLAERMSPSVVSIYTKTGLRPRRPLRGGPMLPRSMSPEDLDLFFRSPFGGVPFGGEAVPMPPREAQALGSGFVIDADEGYIVTNSHVVRMAGQNADEIMVKFIGEDTNDDSGASKGHSAKIIGVDEATDVALLKLEGKRPGLRAAPMGDSGLSKVGEWVVAIGNPYGHAHTLTQGIVSALGRNIEGARTDFIQTSASINPGNSGGPLFNLKGEVIGINTAIDARAQGIGFAIPINTAKNVISQLMAKGRVARSWLGLGIQDIDDEIAGYMRLHEAGGVLVKEVVEGAPAASAGVQPYDVIRKVNGKDVKTSRELVRSIENLLAGQTAELEIFRGSEVKKLKVRVAEQPAPT